MNDFDFGWLVAIIEGEGHIRFNLTPRIRVVTTDADVAQRTAELMNGNFQVPRPGEGRKQIYAAELMGDGAASLMMRLFPFMSRRKQQQIKDALTKAARTGWHKS